MSEWRDGSPITESKLKQSAFLANHGMVVEWQKMQSSNSDPLAKLGKVQTSQLKVVAAHAMLLPAATAAARATAAPSSPADLGRFGEEGRGAVEAEMAPEAKREPRSWVAW